MCGSKRAVFVVGRRWRLLATLAILPVLMAIPASSTAAPLAPTPYMGWNTYYGVGGVFNLATIESVATSLVNSGLAAAGYRIVWLDFGWASGARNSGGELIVNNKQWPGGMSALTAWLHAQGLLAGIYTDAGTSGCSGQGVGSFGHYQQDMNTFAQWGFDAVKVDFCGAGQHGMDPRVLYPQIAAALAGNAVGRPMLLNVCNFWLPGAIDGTNPSVATSSYGNYAWAPQISQSWRTDTDIGFPGNIVFANVLRNLDQDATHPEVAGPGHWNDPDYLGPELGMTATEAQSQFSMWAMLSAPLMLGSDPRALSAASISMLENPQVIAIDQDPLGIQAKLSSQTGSGQVWVKPLASGALAVALLNRGTSALQISTTAGAIGLPRVSSYYLQNLWTGQPSLTTSAITAMVPPHGVVLYRVTALGPLVKTQIAKPKPKPKHKKKKKKPPPKRKHLRRQSQAAALAGAAVSDQSPHTTLDGLALYR